MTKTITRTFTETVATVEIFRRAERKQDTQVFNFNEKLSEDDINRYLYKKYEAGADEMPLFIHKIEYIEKKYSMDIDKFIENAVLVNVSE